MLINNDEVKEITRNIITDFCFAFSHANVFQEVSEILLLLYYLHRVSRIGVRY